MYTYLYLSIYLYIYKGILKKSVKRGGRTTFSSKKDIAEENFLSRDLVGLAYFSIFLLHKHTPKLPVLEDNERILITKRYLNF